MNCLSKHLITLNPLDWYYILNGFYVYFQDLECNSKLLCISMIIDCIDCKLGSIISIIVDLWYMVQTKYKWVTYLKLRWKNGNFFKEFLHVLWKVYTCITTVKNILNTEKYSFLVISSVEL